MVNVKASLACPNLDRLEIPTATVIEVTPTATLVTPKLFDAIMSEQKNLVVLSAPDRALAFAQLHQLALRSGQAMYVWEPEVGIAPMRDLTDRFTTTQRLVDALRHVVRSRHFGVYVFVDVERELKAEHTPLLQAIVEGDGQIARKLVFLGSGFKPPAELADAIAYLRCNDKRAASVRLRDGKWSR